MSGYNIEDLLNDELNENNEISFMDWIQLSKQKDLSIYQKKQTQLEKINKFIQTAPKIKPVKGEVPDHDFEKLTSSNNIIVSETLAKIYWEQKKYQMAIETFEQLSLVYPEKSRYFADQIKLIKKEIV